MPAAPPDNSAANLIDARFYHQNALNYARGIDRMSEADMAWVTASDD